MSTSVRSGLGGQKKEEVYLSSCQVEWIENMRNRKIFNRLITGLILGLSTSLTLVSYLYEDNVRQFRDRSPDPHQSTILECSLLEVR